MIVRGHPAALALLFTTVSLTQVHTRPLAVVAGRIVKCLGFARRRSILGA
jgi:hypothetical protein